MTKLFREITLTLCFILLIGCDPHHPDGPLHTEQLTQDETEQVDRLLKELYQSFSYDAQEEPDWELMRSVFFEGAQFVNEAPAGKAPSPQTIEEFIASWQKAIRGGNSPTVETTERIISAKTMKVGRLIRVDVVFQASKSNDPSPRKPGLDSLVLANVEGIWKILSCIIQYESKL